MVSAVSDRVRARVARRADYCCEYCLIHEDDGGFAHQIDHIVSRKHGGSSDFQNLAYACVFCNRHKGSDIASIDPETAQAVRLFHFIRVAIAGATISGSTADSLSRLPPWAPSRLVCFD